MKQGKSRRSGTRRFWQIVEGVCLVVFLLCMILVAIKVIRYAKRREEQQAAQETLDAIEAAIEETAEETVEETVEETMEELDEVTDTTILPMFEEAEQLLEQNPDFVGIVSYGETTLYVCQSDDNSYYATHRFDGTEDETGMIYMDARCTGFPASDNIILYGHDMDDGTLFGSLHLLTQQEYLEEYPTVRFSSLYEVHDYAPIAVFYASVETGTEDYFYFPWWEFETEEDFQYYIEAIQELSVLDLDAEVAYGTPLLTLATCSDEEGVYLVVVCAQVS